jgi:hypothetical protein
MAIWGGWERLGGSLFSPVSTAARGPNRLGCLRFGAGPCALAQMGERLHLGRMGVFGRLGVLSRKRRVLGVEPPGHIRYRDLRRGSSGTVRRLGHLRRTRRRTSHPGSCRASLTWPGGAVVDVGSWRSL